MSAEVVAAATVAPADRRNVRRSLITLTLIEEESS